MDARFSLPRSPRNPIVQALSWLAGVIVLVGAFLMGTVILVIVLGVGLLLGLYLWLRLAWARRRIAGLAGGDSGEKDREAPERHRARGARRVIDVEYTVVERDDPDNH
jgi:hypothetical protein